MKLFSVRSSCGSLRELEPILRCWQTIVASFTEKVGFEGGADSPYWHNERANVGLLAAASWQEGVPALEEYGEDKLYEGEIYKGRVDLWLHLPPDDEGLAVEAKILFLKAGECPSLEDVQRRVSAKMRDAVKAADQLHTYTVDRRLALSFVIPSVFRGEEAWIEDVFIAGVVSIPENDVVVWAPAALHRCPTYKGRMYPGVMLCARRPVPGGEPDPD